jgi:hypothetical protein
MMASPAGDLASRVSGGQAGVSTDPPDRHRAHARIRRTGVNYALEE